MSDDRPAASAIWEGRMSSYRRTCECDGGTTVFISATNQHRLMRGVQEIRVPAGSAVWCDGCGAAFRVDRWTRFLRSARWPWRDVEGCPHPKERRRVRDGTGFAPACDVSCDDCGALLFDGHPNYQVTEEGARAEGSGR